jgi:hypothetical protein
MAYFAGAGTVVAAVVAGLGGGLLLANIVSPHSPKNGTEMTKLEQRMSSWPIPVVAAPSEPVPYITATQPAAPGATTAQAPPQTEPPAPKPATEAVAANPSPPSDKTQAAAAQPAPHEQAAAPQESQREAQRESQSAVAKARDADAKARDADARRVTERRRPERRQQWADRRRYQPRQDQELRDVERKVREETEPVPAFAPESARLEMPRIRLFDPE